jgi:DNA-binding NarL/FixJ family response regulator
MSSDPVISTIASAYEAQSVAIVADDHPIFCDGLAQTIARLMPELIVKQAATFDGVLAAAQAGPAPTLFLLDLNFPGMHPVSSIALLRQAYPGASIVIVSMSDDTKTIEAILRAGADGFISKATSPEAFAAALADVQAGGIVALQGPARLTMIEAIEADFPTLTPRQIEVLKLLVSGLSNKEIARTLNLSPFTIRMHVSGVLHELGVTTRAAAAAIGARYRDYI